MSFQTIARKTVNVLTKDEQIEVKGGNTTGIIITDTTLV